jgi:hypothetical protein
MATGYPLSTIAFSVHEAITVLDRPLSPEEIREFLARVYHAGIELGEVDLAVAELKSRGHLQELTHGRLDTVRRRSGGRRASPPDRDRRPVVDGTPNQNFGWF